MSLMDIIYFLVKIFSIIGLTFLIGMGLAAILFGIKYFMIEWRN